MMKFGHKTIINGFGLIMLLSCIQLTIIEYRNEPPKAILKQQDVHTDLLFLEQQINNNSIYTTLYPERSELINQRLQQQLSTPLLTIKRGEFAAQLLKLLSPLDDSTSVVTDISLKYTLPIKLWYQDGNWLALNQQNQVLDETFPYLTHIDGIPMSRWVKASQRFLTPSLQEMPNQQANIIHLLPLLRQDIGLQESTEVRLTLSDLQQSKQLSLALAKTQPKRKFYPTGESFNNSLNGIFNFHDLSQFRVGSELEQALKQAIYSPITILDLRTAYGGGDQLLTWLSHYYAGKVKPPYNNISPSNIYAVGLYRPITGMRSDDLKPLLFTPYRQLDIQAQNQIDIATQSLNKLFDTRLSHWYGRQLQSQYDEPLPQQPRGRLVLLIGPQCKQQCQWIVHFAKQWPNTLLVGEPTLGNYDKHHSVILPKSKISVSLTNSMIYDMQANRLSGVPTKPDISLSIAQYFYWKQLIPLVDGHGVNLENKEDNNEKPN